MTETQRRQGETQTATINYAAYLNWYNTFVSQRMIDFFKNNIQFCLCSVSSWLSILTGQFSKISGFEVFNYCIFIFLSFSKTSYAKIFILRFCVLPSCFNLSSRPLSVCLTVSVPLYYLQEYPVLLCLLKKSVFNTVITCIICTTIVIIIIIHKQTDICQHTAYFVFLHKVTPGPRFEIMSHMYAHTDSKVAHLFWLLICT